MRDLNCLNEALAIEEAALASANKCIAFYRKMGDTDMLGIMEQIAEDEKDHTRRIKEQIEMLKA